MIVQIGELYPIGSRTHPAAANVLGESQVTEGTMRTNRQRMFHRAAFADKHV